MMENAEAHLPPKGAIQLAKEAKGLRPSSLSRRDFLAHSLLWAPGAFASVPPLKHTFAASRMLGADAGFADGHDLRVTPHYRLRPPLDDVLRKVEPGFDAFVSEKYAEEIEAVLAKWSAGLLQSPAGIEGVENSLSLDFEGSSLRPTQRLPLRPLTGLEVYVNKFSGTRALGKQTFLAELQFFIFSTFPKLLTAEFKLTAISAASGLEPNTTVAQTRVRYDLVGTGPGFFRGQRVGEWEIEWESDAGANWRARKWQGLEETESRATFPVFTDITAQVLVGDASYKEQMLPGIDYWRTILDGASHIDVYGNNGICCGDIDNDGFDDLYVCQPAGLPNRLYRNRGDGTFEDVTESAGVGVLDNCPCALLADIDNDGHQDLIVVRVDGPLLFVNQGDGRFRLKPDAFRFASPPQGTFTGAALADYDRDGFLDIYFCLYSYYLGLDQYHFPAPYYDAQNGPPNFMMRNNGDSTFTDVTAATGMNQNNNRYSFTCGWTDDNGDGWPDCYVVNDFGKKNLYRNSGQGTFTDVAREAGVEDVGAGMSVCWWDCDNDGRQDLYVADMWTAAGERVSAQPVFANEAVREIRGMLRKHATGNSLFHGEGNGHYSDATGASGTGMGRWAWSSDSWDFDNDGYPDLYIANGMISGPNRRDLSSFFWRQVVAETPLKPESTPRYEQGWNAINELIRADGTWSGYERNNFYANNRDGTFSEISGSLGLDFIEDSRAFVLADFDHDGRLEVFLKNRSGPQLRILKNELASPANAISFRLHGHKSNRDAIGASITVECGKLRQVKFLQAGSGFLSQHTKELFFGLGSEPGPARASVRWPSGVVQQFARLPAGHRILIEEGSDRFQAEGFRGVALTWSPGTATGEQSSPAPPSTAETWLLAPLGAPDFSLPAVDGRQYTLARLRGGPVLLYFWAMRSAAGVDQLKGLQQRHTTWSARGLKLLALNVDGADEADQVRAYFRERSVSFPVLLASEETVAVYNIIYRYLFDRRRDLGIPTSFLLDERGSIVKVYQGPLPLESVEADFRRIPTFPAERMKRGLPFSGDWYAGEFSHNHFTYALIFLERGYFDQALSFCRLALEEDPESPEAHYLLGMVYLKKEMPTEAGDNFKRTLKFPPAYPDTWPNAWNNLGMLAAQAGQDDEAIKDLQEAIRQNPNNVIALDNLGSVYRRQGRWSDAQTALKSALKADPGDADANYGLGMVFAQRNDSEQAYEYLTKALQIRPDYPDALNNLGVLEVRGQRFDEAVATLSQCIRVAPQYDQCYINLAKVYVVQGDSARAKTVLQQLLIQHPDHELAREMLEQLDH
jgi:tetratricopeptide (TPR) repeat protein/peroxiredoxin